MQVNLDGLKNELIPTMQKAIENFETAHKTFSESVALDEFGLGIAYCANTCLELKETLRDFSIWVYNKIYAFERIEEKNAKAAAEALWLQYQNYGDEIFKYMTPDEFYSFFANLNTSEKSWFSFLKNENMNENYSDYGVDQAALKEYFYYDRKGNLITNEFFDDVVTLVMEKYNMTEKDATLLITCLDSIGVCHAASVANNIFADFAGNSSEFEEVFGFPMFKPTKDGKIVLNSEELLIDLFVFINSEDLVNDGLIIRDSIIDMTDEGLIMDEDMIEENPYRLKQQQYYRTMTPWQIGEEEYLKSKTSSYSYDSTYIAPSKGWTNELNDQQMDDIKSRLYELVESGYQIDMSLDPIEENIFFDVIDEEKTWTCELDGSHSVKVTEVREDGLVFATWGKKAFIPYEELQKKGHDFSVIATKIVKNSDD